MRKASPLVSILCGCGRNQGDAGDAAAVFFLPAICFAAGIWIAFRSFHLTTMYRGKPAMRSVHPSYHLELDAAARANEALSRSRISDIQRISAQRHDGGILLNGRVRTYYHKQLAQEIVRNAINGGL